MSHAKDEAVLKTFAWLGVRTWEAECLLPYFPIVCSLTLEHSELPLPGWSLEDESGERRLWGSGELTSLLPAEIARQGPIVCPQAEHLLSYLPLADRVGGLPEPVWKIERRLQTLWSDKGKTREWAAHFGVPIMPMLSPEILLGDVGRNETFVLQRGEGSCGAATYIGKGRDLACLPRTFDAADAVVSRYRLGMVINGHIAVYGPRQVEIPWPSVQLVQPVGEGALTRPLYAGNDFAAYQGLPVEIKGQAEYLLSHVGSLAAKEGYQGLLGADLLYSPSDGQVALLEINARMQGSTGLLSLLESAAGLEPTVVRVFRNLLGEKNLAVRKETPFPHGPEMPTAQFIHRKGLNSGPCVEAERLFVYGRADPVRVKLYGVVEREVFPPMRCINCGEMK